MSTQHSSLVVVGSVAIDNVITPHAERDVSVGGAATYFAIAASYFAPVRLVGVVGGDFPSHAIEDLNARQIDLEGLEVIPAGKTFRWKGRYHRNMNQRDTLETQLGVFETFEPRLPESYRNSPYLFLANIQPKLQLQVLEQMKRPRLVGLDTMNLWIDIARQDLIDVVAKIDLIVINEEEARQLSGEHNLVLAARAIAALGPRYVVIKQGEYGALLFDENGVFSAPALPLERVVDPTGAGDVFAGGLMGYLARGVELNRGNLRTAMIYGSVLASYCVQGFSYDEIRHLDTKAIQARFEMFKSLTDFARDERL